MNQYDKRTMSFVNGFVATMKRRGYTREQVFAMINTADANVLTGKIVVPHPSIYI